MSRVLHADVLRVSFCEFIMRTFILLICCIKKIKNIQTWSEENEFIFIGANIKKPIVTKYKRREGWSTKAGVFQESFSHRCRREEEHTHINLTLHQETLKGHSVSFTAKNVILIVFLLVKKSINEDES